MEGRTEGGTDGGTEEGKDDRDIPSLYPLTIH